MPTCSLEKSLNSLQDNLYVLTVNPFNPSVYFVYYEKIRAKYRVLMHAAENLISAVLEFFSACIAGNIIFSILFLWILSNLMRKIRNIVNIGIFSTYSVVPLS